MTTAERSEPTWGRNPAIERKRQRGKLVCLVLLLYGLAVTLLFCLTPMPSWFARLVPFALADLVLRNWFDPTWLFLLAALLALGGWLLLHGGRLWGREVILGVMLFYLLLSAVLTPFYLILGTGLWDPDFVKTVFSLCLCGFAYPILVLASLHAWNPRRK